MIDIDDGGSVRDWLLSNRAVSERVVMVLMNWPHLRMLTGY